MGFSSPPWQRRRRESSPQNEQSIKQQQINPLSPLLPILVGNTWSFIVIGLPPVQIKKSTVENHILLPPAMRPSPSLSSSLRSATCSRVTSFTSPRLICHSAKTQTIATPTTRTFSGGSASLLGLRSREPLLQVQRSFFPDFPSFNCALRTSVRSQERCLSTSPILREVRSVTTTTKKSLAGPQKSTPIEPELEAFGRSEKATKAAQVNLSARLHKDGNPSAVTPGLGEIVRLLKIARPEAKWLAGTQDLGRC